MNLWFLGLREGWGFGCCMEVYIGWRSWGTDEWQSNSPPRTCISMPTSFAQKASTSRKENERQ